MLLVCFNIAGVFSMLGARFKCCGRIFTLGASAGVFSMLRACAGVRAFAGVKKKDPFYDVHISTLAVIQFNFRVLHTINKWDFCTFARGETSIFGPRHNLMFSLLVVSENKRKGREVSSR